MHMTPIYNVQAVVFRLAQRKCFGRTRIEMLQSKIKFWVLFLCAVTVQALCLDIDLQLLQDRRRGDEKLVIVDTDTAVDDAMGLTLMLTQRDWRVIAVTTVFGNVNISLASANALKTLNAMKRNDIPVYQGTDRGLNYEHLSDNFFGEDGLGGKGNKYSAGNLKLEKETAANALVRLVRERPGQISVVALGPLTNLALAQRLDNQFLKNVKKIHVMGGSVNGTGNLPDGFPLTSEFNFAHDPEAVNIILSETPTRVEIFSWETCMEGGVSWHVYDRMANQNSLASRFIADISANNVRADRQSSNKFNTYCDFFSVVATVNPKSVKSLVPRYAVMELKGEYTRGMMVIDKNERHRRNKEKLFNVDIIASVDEDESARTIMKMATFR